METLWLDWCEVTSTSPDQLDEPTLGRFRREAGASLALLAQLRRLRPVDPAVDLARAPAWPQVSGSADQHRRPTLGALLASTSRRLLEPHTLWTTRLRLRRLQFAVVLLAPRNQQGLALTRHQAAALTPRELIQLRPSAAPALEATQPTQCPACAVSAWLEILGTANTWSRLAVRELVATGGTQALSESATHRCRGPDAAPAWKQWLDHPNLLPAIDRWGYLETHSSLHIASISVLIRTIQHELQTASSYVEPKTSSADQSEPQPAVRHISAEEEAAILQRADEVNARVRALLAQFGAV